SDHIQVDRPLGGADVVRVEWSSVSARHRCSRVRRHAARRSDGAHRAAGVGRTGTGLSRVRGSRTERARRGRAEEDPPKGAQDGSARATGARLLESLEVLRLGSVWASVVLDAPALRLSTFLSENLAARPRLAWLCTPHRAGARAARRRAGANRSSPFAAATGRRAKIRRTRHARPGAACGPNDTMWSPSCRRILPFGSRLPSAPRPPAPSSSPRPP